MCTVSWFAVPDGYRLFFNRDERRTRGRAHPPALRTSRDRRWVAAADSDFGGTWLATSELGLTLALLNGYSPADFAGPAPPGGWTSRGLLLGELIDCATPAAVLERLGDRALSSFRSFELLALAADGTATRARWAGGALALDERPPEPPIVSSSFDAPNVRASRIALFRERVTAGAGGDRLERHLAYHRSHLPERGAFSPCMHRPDAHTVSFSAVAVDREAVRFEYTDDAPCRGIAGPAVVLERREASPL